MKNKHTWFLICLVLEGYCKSTARFTYLINAFYQSCGPWKKYGTFYFVYGGKPNSQFAKGGLDGQCSQKYFCLCYGYAFGLAALLLCIGLPTFTTIFFSERGHSIFKIWLLQLRQNQNKLFCHFDYLCISFLSIDLTM